MKIRCFLDSKRDLLCQHFVCDNSDGPNIDGFIIFPLSYEFRCKVERSSAKGAPQLFLGVENGPSKVTYFDVILNYIFFTIVRRMFSGLMSLCMMLLLWRYSTALHIYLLYWAALSLLSPFFSFNLGLYTISYKFSSVAYSHIR